MGRDLFHDPYGRFYNLSLQLSRCGHDVKLVLFSYLAGENESRHIEQLEIRSLSILPNFISNLRNFLIENRQYKPDWIIGFSDTYFGILASYLAMKLDKRCLIDAYDNYESYISWAFPLHVIWRKSLARADVVTCAGPSLVALMSNECDKNKIRILPMTADQKFRQHTDKLQCRATLGLPEDMRIVGYSGSLHDSRDIETLFEAANKVIEQDSTILFVLTGRLGRGIKIPAHLDYLGYLDNEMVPYFLNSLDLLIVMNRDSKFGHFSYPVKLYEAIACQVPVIASSTESTQWILRDYPELLVKPGDAGALAEKILSVLNSEKTDYVSLPTWEDLGQELNSILAEFN